VCEKVESDQKQRRRGQLFGRAKGHPLSLHQQADLTQAETKYALRPEQLIDKPLSSFFDIPCSAYELEIGFGAGEHLIHRAHTNPHIGYIGCEPFLNGYAKAAIEADKASLTNIRLYHGDAREILEALAPSSIQIVHVLYPDPWPKRRQNKRRFISEQTLPMIARVLKDAGALHFATDIDDYAAWTLKRVDASKCFTWNTQKAADWLQPWEGWIPTRYEQKARREGRPSSYLSFLNHKACESVRTAV
jgi:tRNA (guanine-N7-)-methyltransferase